MHEGMTWNKLESASAHTLEEESEETREKFLNTHERAVEVEERIEDAAKACKAL